MEGINPIGINKKLVSASKEFKDQNRNSGNCLRQKQG
jgi:hypothetical protein